MADEDVTETEPNPIRPQDAAVRFRFLPATNGDERPAVELGDVLVFTYVKDGTVCVTVDTEDATRPVDVRININAGTVFRGTIDGWRDAED